MTSTLSFIFLHSSCAHSFSLSRRLMLSCCVLNSSRSYLHRFDVFSVVVLGSSYPTPICRNHRLPVINKLFQHPRRLQNSTESNHNMIKVESNPFRRNKSFRPDGPIAVTYNLGSVIRFSGCRSARAVPRQGNIMLAPNLTKQ